MLDGSGVQTYRYDGMGRRVQATGPGTPTEYWMYSQGGQLLYTHEQRRSRNLAYIYLGNTQVATRAVAFGTGAVTVRYQHTDSLGSPVAETDDSGLVVKRNSYSPYGEAYGATAIDGTGYTGHVMDQGTGLTYMQQRYYDPAIGRFLSNDPVSTNANTGASFNRYNYANNNPYRFTDPDGRQSAADSYSDAFAKQAKAESEKARGDSSANREAGKVYVTTHSIEGVGPKHIALEFKDNSGTHVVSGGPEKAVPALDPGSLISGKDAERPTDAPENNSTVGIVTPPEGMTPAQYFSRIQAADSHYCDCANYDYFPSSNTSSVNSNGYVAGLIQATGGTTSANLSGFVGGGQPLPAGYFNYKDAKP